MLILRRLARALTAGALAGMGTLAIDELLAFLTLGYWLPLAWRHGAAYGALGAMIAAVVELAAMAFRRPAIGRWTVFALAATGIYALAIVERVHLAIAHRSALTAVAAATLAALGYGLWIMFLRWIASSSAGTLAVFSGALAAAAGLALNRNLVNYPLEPAALIADAAVLVGSLVIVCVARLAGARRAFALVTVGGIAVVIAVLLDRSATPPVSQNTDRPPNLIMVVIDTLRQDVFQAVVDSTAEGQVFRQATGGTAWFSRAIAVSPWTVPSIGTIMTGLYPQEHGFDTSSTRDPSRPLKPLAESVPTLASNLKRLGYLTEAIGTNPLLQPVSGIARGFERYEILSGPTVKLPALTVLSRLGLLRNIYYQPAGSVRHRLRQRLGRIAADGRPVFLWLHLLDPHAPLQAHPGLPPDPAAPDLTGPERLYRDEVRYALAELSRMFDLLRSHGLWDNTALIVVSDHGEMFPSDGHDNGVKTLAGKRPKLYGHGHALYGELVRVPLLIRPPGGLPENRHLDLLTSHADLYDTAIDLLGIDLPRTGRDRVSLAPWLTRDLPETPPRSRALALIGANQHGPEQRALRTPTLKLIDYPKGQRPTELYLLPTDPGERRNLAGKRARKLAHFQRRLAHRWSRLREPPETLPTELDSETLKRLRALGYLP